MPVGSIAIDTVLSAVKTVMELVEGVGKIETRVGGRATWLERARPKQAFWELSVSQIEERGAGVGPQAFEQWLVRIEGVMPLSYEADTETTWKGLIDSLRTTLRQYPTFGNLADGMTGPGLVQVRINEPRPYSEERQELLCHFCRIELNPLRHFTYTVSATLP